MYDDKARKLADLAHAIEQWQSGEQGGELTASLERDQRLAPVRARALRLLSHRARSVHELRQRLLEAECPQASVEEVIDDLVSSGLLDDEAFAADWVRQRRTSRGKSVRALNLELREKGISAQIRTRVLAEVDRDDEREVAYAVATKHARRITRTPESPHERAKYLKRILDALARRGFPQAVAMEVARQALDERLEEL